MFRRVVTVNRPNGPRPVTPASILAAEARQARRPHGPTSPSCARRPSWPPGWTRTWSGDDARRRPRSSPAGRSAPRRTTGPAPAGAGDALRPRRGPGAGDARAREPGAAGAGDRHVHRLLRAGDGRGAARRRRRGGVRDRRRGRARSPGVASRGPRRGHKIDVRVGPALDTLPRGSRGEALRPGLHRRRQGGATSSYLERRARAGAARAARPGLRRQHPDAGAALDVGRADRERRRDRTRSTGRRRRPPRRAGDRAAAGRPDPHPPRV